MKEKSNQLRKLLYSLLSFFHFNKKEDYECTLRNILDNLRLYPEDKIFIFELIKRITQNNIEFLNTDFISKILDLDSNMMIQEYNWNSLEYISKLIILQEIIKSKNFSINISLPKFIQKHLNYLSQKYPYIFEKSFSSFIVNGIKSNMDNMLLNIIDFEFSNENCEQINLCEDIELIFQFFKFNTVQTSDIILEDYYLNIFSLVKIFNRNEQKNLLKNLLLFDYILTLLTKINIQLSLVNNSDFCHVDSSDKYRHLILINEALGCYFIYSLYNLLDHQVSISIQAYTKEIVKKLECDKIIEEFFKKNFQKNEHKSGDIEYEKIFSYFQKQYTPIIKSKLIIFKITNPKNNFNYMHTKDRAGMKFPFFLNVCIKISNLFKLRFSYETVLARNLFLKLSKLNGVKFIQIEPFQIKYVDKDNILNINLKFPVYMEDNESNEFSLNLVAFSFLKKEFHSILEQLNLRTTVMESICLSNDINFILY